MALAHPGFVQKVMEKVMPQSWAVRRDKVAPVLKSQTQRSQALNERPDSALSPPLRASWGQHPGTALAGPPGLDRHAGRGSGDEPRL